MEHGRWPILAWTELQVWGEVEQAMRRAEVARAEMAQELRSSPEGPSKDLGRELST